MDLSKITKKLKNRKDVLAVYLFGSYARGKVHKNSDVDICVIPKTIEEGKQKDLSFIIDISKDFPDSFDVVNFYRLPIQIQYRVFKEGKEFFSKNKRLVSLIKFNTIHDYLEMKPFFERMYDIILKRGRKHG